MRTSLEDYLTSLSGLLIFPMTEQPSYTLFHTPLEHCSVPGHTPLLRAGEMASTACTYILAFGLYLDTGSPLSQGHKQWLARFDRWIAHLSPGGMTLGFALSGLPIMVICSIIRTLLLPLDITIFHFPSVIPRITSQITYLHKDFFWRTASGRPKLGLDLKKHASKVSLQLTSLFFCWFLFSKM